MESIRISEDLSESDYITWKTTSQEMSENYEVLIDKITSAKKRVQQNLDSFPF